MHLFYIPGVNLRQSFDAGEVLHTLPDVESAHMKVMRLKAGDAVRLTDGIGHFADAVVEDVNPKKSTVSLLRVIDEPKDKHQLTIAAAPTKNISRYEWFIEKATETGIDSIIPIYCEHSERGRLHTDRLEKVTIAAVKQSLKARLPVINEPIKLDEYLNNCQNSGRRFIAWIDDSVNDHLKNCIMAKTAVRILIGPEGDFSRRGVELAV
ncbi:MAG: RsmE family RNA methyltransferase [Lentimicrobium sp.]|nr:RsmE family RNA methyltransferase [Lentimicrobium sp.]